MLPYFTEWAARAAARREARDDDAAAAAAAERAAGADKENVPRLGDAAEPREIRPASGLREIRPASEDDAAPFTPRRPPTRQPG